MAKQKKESKVEEAPKAEAKATPKAESAKPKVVSSKRMSEARVDRSAYAKAEGILLKDHGSDKKGDTISRHPNTLDMLKKKGIVK